MSARFSALLFAFAGLGSAATLARDDARLSIAAAANLVYALEPLLREFEAVAPGVKVTVATGASGSLFAQIRHAAPFDVFLSADTAYPRRLVAAGGATANTLTTYATGRLVLWTTRSDLSLADLAAVVRDPRVKKIAVAQPQTAPYGEAALATLRSLDALDATRPKLVTGENVTQAAQFVETGSADLGFVALSLLRSPRLQTTGRWVEVPGGLYEAVSLDHAAVLTRRGETNPAARAFLEFLKTEPARRVLRDFGYGVPN